MELYNETELGPYPSPMTSNPQIWGHNYKTFLYPIFAVYFEKQKRFGLYRVRVADAYHILEPYRTERPTPYFLHKMGNPSDIPAEVYTVKAQFSFCTWFDGAWLCRKAGTAMSPILPIMKLTNFPNNCKYTKYYSTAIYQSPAALEWVRQHESADKALLRAACAMALPIPYRVVSARATVPSSLPKFVATLLIEDAIREKKDCSITMEPIAAAAATVTSCYHVFDKDAITTWLSTNKTCPVCKQECVV